MKKFSTQPSWHRVRMLFLFALVALATACSSVRFTYNNGDTMLYWWLNNYLDLDGQQSGFVKQDIDQLFQWHRQTQLRDYAGLLSKWQRQLSGNPTQEDLLANYRDIRVRTELLALKAVPELADLARSVKPEQLAQLEKKFASNNEKFRKKFMQGNRDKQQQARFERSMDQLEQWFGDFSREQETILRKVSDARPLDNEAWLQERQMRQQKIIALVRKVQHERLSKEQTMAQIHSLLREFFDRPQAPERKAFYDAQLEGTTRFILTAINIATPAQKAHAQKRMQGWAEDFKTLAASAK